MSHVIPTFNPGDTVKYPNGTGSLDTQLNVAGRMIALNDSPYNLILTFGDGNQKRLPSGQTRLYNMPSPAGTVAWRIEDTLNVANSPASVIRCETYEIDEVIPESYPVVLARTVTVGNQVSTTAAQSVINDGQVAPTVVVEGTPQGAGSSQLKLNNDGSGVLGGGHIGVDNTGHVTGATIDGSEISGAVASATSATNASNVSAAGVGAGTLGAGVVVPAANVSGTVASATNSTNATNASNVPATGVTAGALPAGVTIPGGQVSSAVANASAVPAAGVGAGTLGAGVNVPAANVQAGNLANGVYLAGALTGLLSAGTPNLARLFTPQVSGQAYQFGVATYDGTTGHSAILVDQTGKRLADTVPATGVTAGALPAGVTIPGGQVSSAVANASAVPATGVTAGALPAGVTIPVGQVTGGVLVGNSAGGGVAGPTEWRGTTDPGVSAAEGDSWDAV